MLGRRDRATPLELVEQGAEAIEREGGLPEEVGLVGAGAARGREHPVKTEDSDGPRGAHASTHLRSRELSREATATDALPFKVPDQHVALHEARSPVVIKAADAKNRAHAPAPAPQGLIVYKTALML